ncbi:MAG: FG-GAP-like repeat-containing protein [Cyclobacteriaceae bacterium]
MKKILLFIVVFLSFCNLGAQTWVKTNGPYGGEVKDIVVHPTGTVYALGGNPNQAIFRSNDNGNNWVEQIPSAMLNDDANRINDLYLAADGTIWALAYSNVYKTSDNGATWIKVNAASGSSLGGFDSGDKFAINVLSGTIYIMGYHSGDGLRTVFRSVDNGVTWSKGYQGQYFSQIVSNAISEVYGLSSGGIWKSTDDGTTFVQLVAPVQADILSNATSLTARSDGTQLALSTYNSTLYTLSSPFTTWTQDPETNIVDGGTYGSNSKLLYSADNSVLFLFDNTNNKVYSRTCCGWTIKSTTFITANGEDVACAASKDVSNLYIGSQIGVHKSINGGLGWTEVNSGIDNLLLSDIVVADNGHVITSGTSGFRSTDAGQSWTKISTAGTGYTVLKASTGSPKTLLLLAKGGGTSYKSIDNGASWTNITATPNADQFASPDGTKILGFRYNGLHYSSNQGSVWSAALAVSGLPASYSYYSAAMDQNSVIYAYLYDYTGSYKFYKIVPNSTTAPTTATATEILFSTIGVTSIQDVKFLNNKVYVLGYGSPNDYISYTSDAGVSWIKKTVPGGFRLDVDPLHNYLFLTRSNRPNYTIYLSRDDATSFTPTTVNVPSNNTRPSGIALDFNGIAYAGFEGSRVHKTTSTIVTPAAPTNLVNSGSSTNRLTLRFNDNASNEQYYVVEKFNGSSYDSIMRVWAQGQGYAEIRNLQPNTSYQFKVYAKNAAGKSGEASITTSTLATCASDIPDNRSWNGTVNGSTVLTNISIRSKGDGVYSISDINNSTTAAATVAPGIFAVGCTGSTFNTYLYSDYPFVPNGNGTWTSASSTLVLKWITDPGVSPQVAGTVTLTVNATDPIPAAPLNAAAYIFSDNSVEVNWVPVAFEKTFTIERKTGAGGTYQVVGTVPYPQISFIDPGPLTLNETYFYRIKSANINTPAGVSPYSNEAQIIFKKPNLVLAQTVVNDTPLNSLGTVWADFNNDGFDDLVVTKFDLFTGNVSVPTFFQNNGTGNFTAVATNLDATNYANATTADYNNDGKVDVFYSTFGTLNRLYNGNGTFAFSKVSPSPVEGAAGGNFEGAPFAASWVDFNKDGLLDLFIGRSGSFNSELFKQNSDNTFTKVTTAGELVNTIIGLFAMAWADYDNDGDQDVFVIDQTTGQADKLFRNNNDGTFTKITGSVFDADAALNGQSVSWADFDNDQDMDLFIGEDAGANALFRNNGNGTFTKLTAAAFDVTNGGALGSNWIDVNNDGFVDLLVTGQAGNSLFINTNGSSFARIAGEKITDSRLFCISVSSSDFNNDGFIDVALSRTSLGGGGEAGIPQNTLLFRNNNTSGNWLKVRLTGMTSNKSGIGARIRATTGSKNQIREVNAHADIASQNSLTQHFGLGTSTIVDNLVVTWPSGIVQTLANVNANATVIITEDGAGPVITARIPAVSATAVPIATSISLTLDEPSISVAGKNLNIAEVSAPTTIIHSLNVAASTISGNTYSFTIPTPLKFSMNYTITIDAGAFSDIYTNNFSGVPDGSWTFTTADPPDVTPPSIVFTTPTSRSKGFVSVTPSITVTDNISVNTVVVSIRKISGSAYTQVAATSGAANSYSVTLSEGTHFDAIGAEFFITATDLAGNSTRDPADPSTTHKVYVSYSAAQAAIPTSSLGLGGTKTAWKVFALPFEISPPNNGFAAIFDELSTKTNKNDYRLITYGTATAWSEYPEAFSALSRGIGYFINIKNDPGAIGLFDLTAPANHRSNLYQMNLKVGWNMVGNPYLTPISWDDVSALNGLSAAEAQLKTFSNGTYSNDQTLGPYEGGFVLVSTAKTISIPFQGQISSGGRRGVPELDNDMSANAWALPITIHQGELTYTLGGIGMAPEAHPGIDDYDDVTPPRFFDFLEMNFAHPEHIGKRFTREIVPTQQNYTWDFTVDSNLEGMAELNWNNAPLLSAGKDLFLLDVSTQQLVNMKEKGGYRFDPKESSKFRIYFGENLRIAPERVQLGKAYPNPTNTLTTIAFSLPETGGLNQSVTLELIDALGRIVGTIKQGKFSPGYHEADFNAKEMMTGFYNYRLTVKNRGGQTTEVNKLIIK